MAGFFLVRDDSQNGGSFAENALDEARKQFALHGFATGGERGGGELSLPGWRLLHRPYMLGGPETFHADGDDFVAVAGTLTFDGLMGRPALVALLAELNPPVLDWRRTGGHFALVMRKNGRTFLFTDWFAAFQLFHDTDHRVFSTSFLSAAKALPKLSFSAQAVYEFAFNVVAIGNDTVLEQLRLLSPNLLVELTGDGCVLHPLDKPLPGHALDEPLEARIARHAAPLHAIVGAHVRAFDAINCPLSGGLDSRLLLGLLRAEGATPRLYVYGGRTSEDVVIAQAIGAAEGFTVEWIDKGRPDPEPADFPYWVEKTFHEGDALPNYGNIFDVGGNAEAQVARHADGALAASGGCGEIFRNFFFLSGRAMSAHAVASSFFARFAPNDGTDLFDRNAFLDGVAAKIAQAVGAPSTHAKIPRAVIEQIYPRVRCRSLFGKEISMEARYGAYLMPFLDHQVVAEAMTLPLGLKNAGRFEAALLNAIDPALARHMSAYGHSFAEPPSRAHRWEEFNTRIRPAWLRAKSYAVRRRLGPMGDEHGGLLDPAYVGRVIDLDMPAMRRFFNLPAINDSAVSRRIACLEYLAAHLGSRMAG